MRPIESDPKLARLAAQYVFRAVALDPNVSVCAIEEAFALHMDEAALSAKGLHGYWELMARQEPLSYREITYNPDRRLLAVRGNRVVLSAQPLKVITYLMYRQEKVVPYEDLFRLVNATDFLKGQSQIRTLLQRIRTGIMDDEHPDGTWGWIQTIFGEGLCLMSRDRVYECAARSELPFSKAIDA